MAGVVAGPGGPSLALPSSGRPSMVAVTAGPRPAAPWPDHRGQLPGWQLASVVPGSAYCATTRLDLADCGPDPALFLAWTVNR